MLCPGETCGSQPFFSSNFAVLPFMCAGDRQTYTPGQHDLIHPSSPLMPYQTPKWQLLAQMKTSQRLWKLCCERSTLPSWKVWEQGSTCTTSKESCRTPSFCNERKPGNPNRWQLLRDETRHSCLLESVNALLCMQQCACMCMHACCNVHKQCQWLSRVSALACAWVSAECQVL